MKICVITGSRAEYGLLRPVIRRIMQDEELKLQMIVTGMHLDTRFGLTVQEIEKDGIPIDEKIHMNLATDSSLGIGQSMGLEMIGLSKVFESLKPDMLLILGDRYEIFAAASMAVIHNIPIAHIHGGEVTEGAFDDCMRHAISKMSYLHFTSTKEYRKRVIQLGEEPDRVHHVGALGIENIKNQKFVSKKEIEALLKLRLEQPFALVTYHPATLDSSSIDKQLTPLLEALDSFPDLFVIFTKSNSDTGGNKLNELIDEYVNQNRKRATAFPSLGSLYLSLMSYSKLVLGNSSSGIIEAPFLNIPAVDIGDRQKGRVKPNSVISCDNSVNSIIPAIQKALAFDWKREKKENPYEKQDTSNQMILIMKQTLKNGVNLKKKFYDID
jgi:UDP-hydrolysing UDP-N-acetyl-D-glucosamine 2-epimerase